MLGYIYDVHDFIDAHYKLSARRDSEFWRYQTSREYPERLELRLAVYAAEMPNHINRVKTGPWAFNEVSWLDILNGYRFEYAKLNVDPMQRTLAQKALQEIAASAKRGLDPRTCVPGVRRPDPRLHSFA
jgi:tryptophan halogenase